MSLASRRFGVRDLMILIAATALGMALLRLRISFADVAKFFLELKPTSWVGRSYSAKVLIATGVLELIVPCFFSWTIGLVVIRLLSPRPRLRRLLVQPGFVACAAFLAAALLAYAIAMATPTVRGRLVSRGSRWLLGYHGIASLICVQQGGWAVFVAWLMLALSRRWIPEPSWVDRLGRVLGIFWMAAALILTDFHNSLIIP
jgi:hypothetical protein